MTLFVNQFSKNHSLFIKDKKIKKDKKSRRKMTLFVNQFSKDSLLFIKDF